MGMDHKDTLTTITSRQNPWFQRFRSALDNHENEVVIEGPKQVADACTAGWRPIAVAVTPDTLAAAGASRAVVFDPRLMKALSDTVHPQEVLGLFERPVADLEHVMGNVHRAVVVALDGIQDPGNIGTIVRLAAAFEAAGLVLLEGCADPLSPKSLRASAGTILLVPFAKASLTDFLQAVRKKGLELYAAAPGPSALRKPPSKKAVIVFGSEGRGVRPEILDLAMALSIDSSKDVESLNVATAAAILLHQSFEERQEKTGA